MELGHIILGRPWIYDLDVTNYERANICIFNFEGRTVKLHPLPPKETTVNSSDKLSEKESNEKERSIERVF